MPCIVQYSTKKAFKQAVKDNPKSVYVADPSIFAGSTSGFLPEVLKTKESITVTNHPIKGVGTLRLNSIRN